MVNKVEQDRSDDCPGATFTFGIGRFFSHDMSNHASESIARSYNFRTITIFTERQAALKALESVKSKLVLECLECLSELATHNSVKLVLVPGHEGILGNEKADELAKKGADTPFTGPEPVLGLPFSNRGRDGEETHRVLEV